MKKLFLTLVALIMAVLPVFSEHITVQTAQRAAQTFLNSKMEGNPQIHLIDFAEKAEFPNFYVFGNGHCFVIIAGDNAVHPVLGYSIEGSFSTDALSDNIHYWLKTYDEAIAIISENKVEATPEIQSEWDNILNGKGLEPKSGNSVKPLIRTRWNQRTPYNDFCPADTTGPNGHAVAGCVAIAMAQIMKYWEHPIKGEGLHTYIPKAHPEYGEQSANFGETEYDWNNMVESYYNATQKQKEAVATLVYHCGVAVDMDYGPASLLDSMGSSASSNNVVKALQRYYHYDFGMELKYKSIYSEKKWISMLKEELNAERPIYYQGVDAVLGGHAFICDGYDEDDYFHFNWGWGFCDGYFIIEDLNPNVIFHFNNQVGAIFGCKPIISIPSPIDVVAFANKRDVTIKWNAVIDAVSYKLYRDNVLVSDLLIDTVYLDNNLVYGEHRYYVKSVGADGTASLKSNTAIVNISYPVPFAINLNAFNIDNDVNLSWSVEEPEDAILQYGSGESAGTIHNSYCAQMYPKSILYDYAGMAINKVSVCFSQPGLYELSLYKGYMHHYSFSSELLYQIDYYVPYSGWQEIELDNPVSLDYLRDLWVVLFSKDGMGRVSYCEYNGPNTSNVAYYSSNGTYWYQLDGPYSWLIKTHLTDGTHSYNIYRNGEVVVSNYYYNTYTDLNLPDGNYVYYVTSNYSGGESTPSNEKIVFVGDPQLFALVRDGKLLVICSDSNYEYNKKNKVEVIDITGRVIISDVFKSNYERNLDLKPGVYVLRLIKNKIVKTQKIVIN